MRRRKRTAILAMLATACAAGVGAVATGAAPLGNGPALTDVATANTKSAGYAPASRLSPELREITVAQGSAKLENGTAQVSHYGYDNDVVNAAGEPQMLPTPAVSNEAHKTEPDKNTYLVFPRGLPGADPSYDYGTHFLFQGHEGGAPGYITRINLDADAAHRVTLLATADTSGAPIADIDGSTWDPWAGRLLFTTENAGDTLHGQRNALDSGYVLDASADYSSSSNQPLRWLAEGRDASATIDSAFGGFGKNDGDNEITGLHVSNGDASEHGILGAEAPKLFHEGWRWFYTQQHGDNPTYEVVPAG